MYCCLQQVLWLKPETYIEPGKEQFKPEWLHVVDVHIYIARPHMDEEAKAANTQMIFDLYP